MALPFPAPFPFMINAEWLDEYKTAHSDSMIVTRAKDPRGFGLAAEIPATAVQM